MHGIPAPVEEFRFYPERKWRADFAWPEYRLLLEVDGGAFVAGRHNRGVGFIKDMEKQNFMTLSGYSFFRFTPKDLMNGYAARMVKTWFDTKSLATAHPGVLQGVIPEGEELSE